MSKPHRNTVFVEDAEILARESFPGEQFLLRVQAPLCAQHARPGSFAHISCGTALALRRPLSIMRREPRQGWVEFLYKAVGKGTRALSQRSPGETLSIMGPIGTPFVPHDEKPRRLLIGGGVGVPPMVFLADTLRTEQKGPTPLVLMGSEVPFPFAPRPSQFMIPGLPAAVTAAMPLMEDWGIPSRLASLQGFPGCHEGYVTELARAWLDALAPAQREEVEIFACGPHPMLEAVAGLARDYRLACQVSLEEFMACGIGGCAGCTVETQTPQGPTMKRVCVDGPVFDARQVFPI